MVKAILRKVLAAMAFYSCANIFVWYCLSCYLFLFQTIKEMRSEGFQRATAKPFGRARRRETLCRIDEKDGNEQYILAGILCGVKASPACTFRLGEKYQKPTGAANLCMRGWPPRTPVS